MKSTIIKAVAALALGAGAVSAQAVVLTFEGLGTFGPFTSNYQGFQFGTNVASTNDWLFDDNLGVPSYTGAITGGWIGTSCNAPFPACETTAVRDSQPVVADTPFFPNSIAVAGNNAFGGPVTLTFSFYDAANALIGSPQQVVIAGSGAANALPGFTFMFTPLATPAKSFVVNGIQAYYALDNFDISPIPEPGTYALMFGGLALIGAVAKRRKQ